MIEYIFKHKYLAYVLSQINFQRFRKDLLEFTTTNHVLMEYTHSGQVFNTMFIASTVPDTSMLVNNIFTEQFLSDLKIVLGYESSTIYTRRKKDKDGKLTEFVELVISIDPDQPPPLIHINEARKY